jgi:hypothetical protein
MMAVDASPWIANSINGEPPSGEASTTSAAASLNA